MAAACRFLADSQSGPVPMAALLRSAGVSSRAFYRHFVSKHDLYLALLEQECRAVVDQVERIADEASGSPVEQLAAWIGAMFDIVVDPGQRMRLIVIDSEEVRVAKGYREVREWLHTERERSLAEILRRGQADGSFPVTDPDTDAVAINATVSRVLGAQTSDDPEVYKQAQVAVVDFALRVVGVPADRR
ncbi:TetR/AcrR family transcriptional regulator [Mycobacterium sp. 236(2023)]|uniref:TetR/AcrR family transcriptional regulator n=1 Tax=Mycobacterium sp. 236(2023) TaxID=3038163 RepID=UPI002414F21A|nr:TetR/AcrR family transcriptional regulator [Mycobacterium sp. 236(2023)]MDG4666082.1 TetR/AcrR family transcriptional regulator [Mycobacterium sp. 236(2023)]